MKLARFVRGAVAVLLLSAGLVGTVGGPASAATDLSALSGYYLDTTWVAPGNDVGLSGNIDTAIEPACSPTSSSDTPKGEGYFYNGAGSQVSVLAKNGLGFGAATNSEYFTIPTTIAAATPIVGTFRFLCRHTDGSATQTVETLPLTVTAVAPSSEFHSALQWTAFSPGDLESGTINAMGFLAGETVAITAVNDTKQSAPLTPITTTADGGGAISARLTFPSAWAASDILEFTAAGQTSRYMLNLTLDPTTEVQTVPLSAQSPGRVAGVADENGTVQVSGAGFAAGEDVVVALHSSAAPIILSTIQADGTGAISELLQLPGGLTGAYRLWAGSKSSSYLLFSTPLQINATTTPSNPVTSAGGYFALAPWRLLDTRSGVGAPTGAVAAGGVVALRVVDRGGVPATGVSAVVLNVTITAPSSFGYLTAYGDGTTRPTASNLNFVPNQTVPNLVIAPVGPDGKVNLYNGSAGTVQVIADVAGWFTASQ